MKRTYQVKATHQILEIRTYLVEMEDGAEVNKDTIYDALGAGIHFAEHVTELLDELVQIDEFSEVKKK